MDSKSRTIKMIAIVAAGMLAAGVLCGCAPFNGKAGEMLRAVTSVNQNKHAEESGTEQEKGEAEKFAIGNADSEDSGGWNGEEKLMKRYEPFGVILHKKDGNDWINGKPLARLRDKGHNTVTNGEFIENGAFALVERDADGKIAHVYENDRESFEAACGMKLS